MLAIEALTLSMLVKFATALLEPPLLLYVWTHADGDRRSRGLLLLRASAVAAVTVVLAHAPFFDGVRFQTVLTITSTPLLLETGLRQLAILGWDDPVRAAEDARSFARLVFLAIYPLLAWDARRDFSRLVTLSFTILFLYLLVAASWYRSGTCSGRSRAPCCDRGTSSRQRCSPRHCSARSPT